MVPLDDPLAGLNKPGRQARSEGARAFNGLQFAAVMFGEADQTPIAGPVSRTVRWSVTAPVDVTVKGVLVCVDAGLVCDHGPAPLPKSNRVGAEPSGAAAGLS